MNAPAAGQNLVIVGASGMVGGYALRYALDHPIMRSPNMGRRFLAVCRASAGRRQASGS
jgi:hypothetical protein